MWEKIRRGQASVESGLPFRMDPMSKSGRAHLSLLLATEGQPPASRADVKRDQAAIKARYVAENGPACMACSTVMPDKSLLNLHHVVPVARGGQNEDDNLALICPNCHAKAHWLDRQLKKLDRPTSRTALLALLKAG